MTVDVRRASALAGVLAACGAAGPALGQERPAAVVPLRLGAVIAVELPAGRIAGSLTALGRDTLVLSAGAGAGPEAGAALVPTAAVRTLWVRGSAWKTGALVGGTVLGAGVGLLGTFACVIGRADDGVVGNDGRWVDCAVLSAAAGFAAGALTGGLVGALVPTWRVRYRARGGAELRVQLAL